MNNVITKLDAAKELRRRQDARRSVLSWSTYLDNNYIIGNHHRILASKLEALERGDITRLMVKMPPQHGKSRLCSVNFPPWYLGRNPKHNIMQIGYSSDISNTHSQSAYGVFNSEPFRVVFPGITHKSAPARSEEWGTDMGGRYYARGVGGGISGKRCNLGIIDDPIKNREEANSPTIRAKVMDWYRSTFYTRLAPDARVVLIMTPWSPYDIMATLAKEMLEGTGDIWDVVEFPAIDDAGNALWPERYDITRLNKIKSVIGQTEWQALYQLRPVLRGGNILKTNDVKIHTSLKDFPATRYIRVWDLASTAEERGSRDPDYTCGALGTVSWEYSQVSKMEVPHIWISNCIFCRENAPQRDKIIKQAAINDGPSVCIEVENFGAYKDAYYLLRDALDGISSVHGIQLASDKLVKLAPAEPIFEAGNVHILKGSWNQLWLDQHTNFTGLGDGHDDAVDTTAILVQKFCAKWYSRFAEID